MSRQTSPLLTATNLGFLLSGDAQAVTVGGIGWSTKREVSEGIIRVQSLLAPCRLRMTINSQFPSEPYLQYLLDLGRDSAAIRRLCMNRTHKEISGTHKHKTPPGGGEEIAYQPDDIPEVPLQPRVAPGTYRAILEAFAAECAVTIGADFTWTEP